MGYKILLADDSVTVQKIITLTFSDEGVDVLAVNNGDEAINRLQYMRPALVMADVSIPGKSGYDICEFVKNHPDMKDTPVILLVPAFEPFDEERARRVGADQHLTKPFQSIRTLISTVKGLLEPSVQHRASGTLKQTAPAPTVEEPLLESAAPIAANESGQGDGAAPPDAPAEVLPELEAPQEETGAAGVSERAEATPEIFEEELVMSTTFEPPPASFAADELDNVLDLDDVLPELWATPTSMPAFTDESLDARAQSPMATAQSTDQALLAQTSAADSAQTVPQAVIDEIVERVVAQLSDRLAEQLSRELARRLAPEVAELVQQPHLSQRVAYQESDSLLDLDEF